MMFRVLGMAEGISFLLLLLIAMPLKYFWDSPEWVRWLGTAHGILFLAYIAAATWLGVKLRWGRRVICLSYVASVLPFGPFVFDRWILRRMSPQCWLPLICLVALSFASQADVFAVSKVQEFEAPIALENVDGIQKRAGRDPNRMIHFINQKGAQVVGLFQQELRDYLREPLKLSDLSVVLQFAKASVDNFPVHGVVRIQYVLAPGLAKDAPKAARSRVYFFHARWNGICSESLEDLLYALPKGK